MKIAPLRNEQLVASIESVIQLQVRLEDLHCGSNLSQV